MYSLVMVLVLAGYLLVTQRARASDGGALDRHRPRDRRAACSRTTGRCGCWRRRSSVLAWRAWRSAAERGPTARVLVAMAAGGVFLLPWLPSMLYQSAHTGTPWASVVRPTTMVTETLQDFGGGDFAEGVLLGWALFGLFLLGLLATRLDDRPARARPADGAAGSPGGGRGRLDGRDRGAGRLPHPHDVRDALRGGDLSAVPHRGGRRPDPTRHADRPPGRSVRVARPRAHRRSAQRGHGPHAGRRTSPPPCSRSCSPAIWS